MTNWNFTEAELKTPLCISMCPVILSASLSAFVKHDLEESVEVYR
jgi:hypothetical protein